MTHDQRPMLAAKDTSEQIKHLELLQALVSAHRKDVTVVADDLIVLMTRRIHLLHGIEIYVYKQAHGMPFDEAEVQQLHAAMAENDYQIHVENVVLEALLLGTFMEA